MYSSKFDNISHIADLRSGHAAEVKEFTPRRERDRERKRERDGGEGERQRQKERETGRQPPGGKRSD